MTQTPDPDCTACGGTGSIPPFMDDCDCKKPSFVGATAAATGTVDPVTGRLWNGTEWVTVPTEALTPSEYYAKYKPVGPADPTDELVAEAKAFAATKAAVEAATELATELAAEEAAAAAAWTAPAAWEALPDGWVPADGRSKAKPATAPQQALLARLLAERDHTHPVVAAALTAATGPLTAREASKLIDAVMLIPANPALKPPRSNKFDGVCRSCGGVVPEMTGTIVKVDGRWVTYHKDGDCLTPAAKAELEADKVTEPGLYKHVTDTTVIYRVRKARTSNRLYAEKIIPLPDAAHDEKQVDFAYNAKAMAWLRRSDKLTWAEARDFGAAYGACVACGRTLSDARSLVQGYGATCAGHYAWPTVSKKEAEAIIAGVLTWDDVVTGAGVLTS
jgi:hypothetical protein